MRHELCPSFICQPTSVYVGWPSKTSVAASQVHSQLLAALWQGALTCRVVLHFVFQPTNAQRPHDSGSRRTFFAMCW